tara:strand:- start:268 stop:507 length:240 start_codon:yes stop_codon:yes gene_type:complete
LTENSTKKITKIDLITKGSLAAAIITIPTLIVFFGVWAITDDLLYGAITGLVANFVALSAAFKIVSKKFTPNKKDDLEL